MNAPSASPLPGSTTAPLRLLTAGSVDDGKSTLIGRLLVDSQAVLADQWQQLEHRAGGQAVDLSLLTDGLEAEREQGITIDVAYRYFATRRRKFVIADAPGHEQYTRNMVTAAAGSDAAVVLVDLTKLDTEGPGPVALLAQTRRHALLAQLLRVRHLVFALNKIDAIAEPQKAVAAVDVALRRFAAEAGFSIAAIVPISALRGDHVVVRGPHHGWYDGPTLLEVLESLPVGQVAAGSPAAEPGAWSMPVQLVARETNDRGQPERVLWGRSSSGSLAAGDTVQVWPSGQRSRVVALRSAQGAVPQASALRSVGVVLDPPVDVSRGDWLTAAAALGDAASFTATVAWLDTEPAAIGRRYWARHGHRWVAARITAIHHRLDIHNLAHGPAEQLAMNDIAEVQIQTQEPLPVRPYRDDAVAGALILVDAANHRTSAAVLVSNPPTATGHERAAA
jgi:sulfate adenylyltransferase subunit 1